MAALPKKKRTQSRKRSRWSHSRLQIRPLSTCPQCRNLKPPHLVCQTCGYYAGREVIQVGASEEGRQET